MAQVQGDVEDEDYDSEADQDFNPDVAHADAAADSSSDEDEDLTLKESKKRKDQPETLDFENSGDEATILKARRKKRKTDSKDADEDDEGGEGGTVKTRAQRKAEGKERKPLIQTTSSSVDVDSLWAQMSGSTRPATANSESKSSVTAEREVKPTVPADESETSSRPAVAAAPARAGVPGEGLVTIKRTYEFAGQRMEEEKLVPASSAEAKLFLEEQQRKSSPSSASLPPKPGMRRPKKRVSMFDAPAETTDTVKGPKLTTLEKSKLDWAAHVDQEGITDELDEHRRAKGGYLARMDFLSRMEAKREEEAQGLKPK